MELLPRYLADVVEAANGTTRLWNPAPGLLVTHVVGVLGRQAAAAMEVAMRRIAAEAGSYQAFNDWENLTNYDHDARIRLTQVAVELGDAMKETHLLLGSKVVQFGIQAANAEIGKLRMHADRRSFQAALRAALQHAGVSVPNESEA